VHSNIQKSEWIEASIFLNDNLNRTKTQTKEKKRKEKKRRLLQIKGDALGSANA
jgi:hypothetical protein